MKLTNQQMRFLKGRAHNLNPAVTIGANGLTPGVVSELDHAFARHELIKVKLPALKKPDRMHLLESLCDSCKATLVTLIGRIGIAYRPAKKPSIVLPQ
jgi:RNA-binding protein